SELNREIEKSVQTGKPIAFDKFIRLMERIRAVATDLNLLSQLAYGTNVTSESDERRFMMELVNVLFPWWQPSDSNLEVLRNALVTLSRMAVGSLPYAGDAVDLYEVLSGKDFLTGERLTQPERVASALGL